MKKNVGKIDKIIRVVIGVLFIIAASIWSWWLLIPAVISIATAAMGTCALYTLFGINTCKFEPKE